MDVFDSRVCVLGEGPSWDPATGLVRWVNVLDRQVLSRSLDGSSVGAFETPEHVSAAILTGDGDLVLCLPQRLVRHSDGATLTEVGGPGLRSNDAKPDPAGRLWHGTMAYDDTPGAGALYRLDPGATATTLVLSDVSCSNGLGWSPDGTTMYYIDSPTFRVDAFDYDLATGEATNRRRFATIDGAFPDGLSIDTEGGVWVACWQGSAVHRYAPDGTLDHVLRVPTDRVTSCAFVGPELDTLIVTTAALDREGDPNAGLTYAVNLDGIRGLPVAPFAA
jgi:sugar lactone lactonase YvrE